LRSEHDLNLAILYAVQSGFRYSASLFLPEPALPTSWRNYAPGIQGNAAPSFKGDSVGRKLIGSGGHSKCFFIPRARLRDLQARPAMLRVMARARHFLQSKRVMCH
jgi:hypothetical protein